MIAALDFSKWFTVAAGAVSGPSLMRLRLKLLAWWDGENYDEAAAEAAIAERFPNYKGVDLAGAATRDANDRYRDKLQNMENRLQVAELLWGPGYVGPGEPAWHADIVKPMTLNEEHSIVMVGAGLGGPARDIANETGAWVAAYERRKDVESACRQQCEAAGMGKKISTELFSPLEFSLPEKKFQGFISLFESHGIPDKMELITQSAGALQKKKPFMLVDYVASEKHDSFPDAFSPYWGAVELWTEDQYKDAIVSAGIDLRVHEDVTEKILQMIADAWANWEQAVKKLEEVDIDDEDRYGLIRILSEEAQLWAARQEALKSRKLFIMRFFGLKKK
ncbi:MAG: hypothetical protein AAGC95_07095 [Pseudomonadota bacterium]